MINKKNDVFIVAEDFSFGPIAILAQLIFSIKNKCNFYTNCSENQKFFLQKNKIPFIKIEDWKKWLRKTPPKAVVSCQEPISAIFAWKNDIPCLYIDNFFWFWIFNPKRVLKNYKDLLDAKNLTDEEFTKIINTIFSKHPHDLYLIVHLLIECSIIQYFGKYISERIKILNKIKKKKYFFYGAVVSKSPDKKERLNREKREKKKIYVQLGGMQNPQMSNDYLIKYAEIICESLNEMNFNKQYEIKCKLHSSLEKLKHEYKNIEIITTIPIDSHLKEIKECDYLFIQPGINGIYEAAFFKKNIFLLPELNPSHSINLGYLFKAGFKSDGFFFKKKFKPKEKDVFNNKYLEKIISLLPKKAYKAILKRKLHIFLNKKENKLEINQRYLKIKNLINNFNGLEELKEITIKFLNESV